MALLAATRTVPSRRSRRLASENLPLVHNIARRVRRELGYLVDLDDLVGPGHEGLVAASRRYDPRRGASFPTFARYRVRGAMLDAARAIPPLVRDGAAMLQTLPSGRPDAEESAIAAQDHGLIQRALATLPPRERHVVVRVYFEGARLCTAGSEVGVSKSWATRLHARALRLLRRRLAAAI